MIRKIAASSLFGSLILAAGMTAFAQDPTPPPTSPPTQQVNLACMETAVDKRDTAILAAVDAYHTSVKAALEKRRTDLKAAWGIVDKTQRREALKKAWGEYKATSRKARKDLKAAKKAAWSKFKTDRNTCNAHGASDDQTSQGVDAQL